MRPTAPPLEFDTDHPFDTEPPPEWDEDTVVMDADTLAALILQMEVS